MSSTETSGCLCYGANTPELENECACQKPKMKSSAILIVGEPKEMDSPGSHRSGHEFDGSEEGNDGC